MASSRNAAKWSKELHLKNGLLGPISGKTAKQIAAEGLKRARAAGDADPELSVRHRLQVLVNLNHPESAKLQNAIRELARDNPTRARQTRSDTGKQMAKRSAPKAPGSRLVIAISKAMKGKLPKGTSFKARGAITKKLNAILQPKIKGNTIPSRAEIDAAIKSVVGNVKASAPKKAAKKKPRTAAQKAATRRMIAANRAKRAGGKSKGKRAKKSTPRPGTATGQRAAAIGGRKRGKKGRGGATPGGKRTMASPTLKQRDVAAAFGITGSKAFSQKLVNLTGEGVSVGHVTRVYYISPKRPDALYKHSFKRNQRPTLYMQASTVNQLEREGGGAGGHKPANRKTDPMGGRWVELGEAHGVDVLVGKKKTTIVFGSRGALPRLLVNDDNSRLALTWYGGAMNRAPARERVMFLQKARGAVVSTRGIVS